MHTKISSDFWSHPEIEPAASDVKLAALWMLTNERMKMCGYAEITEKRFAFETTLAAEVFARALDALPKTFQRMGKGYLAPNYIKWQFGVGPALAKNHMSVPVVRDLQQCPPDVVTMVLSLYPELSVPFERVRKQALAEPSASPTQVEREGEGVREGERAGESVSVGAGVGGPKSTAQSRPPKAGSTRPDEHPEPQRSRMVAIAAIVKRRGDSVWNDAEKKALASAGLLELGQREFDEQVDVMRRLYRAKIPEALARRYWIRTTLPILLNNWPSELDKARGWAREVDGAGDGVTKVA